MNMFDSVVASLKIATYIFVPDWARIFNDDNEPFITVIAESIDKEATAAFNQLGFLSGDIALSYGDLPFSSAVPMSNGATRYALLRLTGENADPDHVAFIEEINALTKRAVENRDFVGFVGNLSDVISRFAVA